MLGFNVESVEEVNRLHAKVLELGGSCEGQPNQRGPMYSAYVRDLDGIWMGFGWDLDGIWMGISRVF